MQKTPRVVEGVMTHLAMYLVAIRQLTDILDHENRLLLFEHTEAQALRDAKRQEAKHALYARVETLARIVTGILKHGAPDDVAAARAAREPVESFRRTLRLNAVLLEMAMERHEKRMQRIMEVAARSAEEPVTVSKLYVADHSL